MTHAMIPSTRRTPIGAFGVGGGMGTAMVVEAL
jgi:hypothetical protein